MYPQQPYGAPTPGSAPPAGQFDFIVNAKPKRNNWLLTASLKTRIFIVGGGFITLLLIAWIVIALLSGGSNNTQQLVGVAQQQAELARVANVASSGLQSTTIKNLAGNIQLSMTSDEQSLLADLTASGNAPSNSALALGKRTSTDQLLANAAANGTYDQTYLSIAKAQLQSYTITLKQTFNETPSAKERLLLSAEYAHAQLLIRQSNQAGS